MEQLTSTGQLSLLLFAEESDDVFHEDQVADVELFLHAFPVL
jgi:hypothetical protein